MKLFLKFASLTIATIGLLISAADALGWFPNARADLADEVVSLGNDVMPLDHDGVDGLLRHFLGEAKYATFLEYRNEMSGIAIEDIRLNTDAYVIGTVYLQHKSGKRHQLCGFQQLHDWAASRKLPLWLGLWLAATGVLLAWAIDILELKTDSREAVTAEGGDTDVSQCKAKDEPLPPLTQ